MADESGSMEELELEVEASNVAEEEDPVDSSDEEGDDATEVIPGFATVEDFCKVRNYWASTSKCSQIRPNHASLARRSLLALKYYNCDD